MEVKAQIFIPEPKPTLTFDAWEIVHEYLIKIARAKGTTTYQHIGSLLGLPDRGDYMSNEVGKIIGEISKYEVKHGRPMLSALVVHKSDGKPGQGFFNFAIALGIFSPSVMTPEQFWNAEIIRVYQTWA